MKFIISESAGRNQAWFDNLGRKEQKAYLEKYPRSKFGKKTAKTTSSKVKVSKTAKSPIKRPAAKPRSADKVVKPVASKLDSKTQAIKNKLDALRQKLATAKPEDIAKIRLQIQKVREQIAKAKKPAAPSPKRKVGSPIKSTVNRGAGNTVMGPGWKKKSSDPDWNTYEHSNGHQARVSKTAGTVYKQGSGPARKIKVHTVETKRAGSGDWNRYGSLEKHQVSEAVRGLK